MISARRVEEILMNCLYKDEEVIDGKPPEDTILAEGIMMKIGFHPERLESHREEIKEILSQLPSQFNEGASFLQGCVDKNGNQWGEHTNMDQLFMLGNALGYVKCPFPRAVWSSLPGGMPYYQIDFSS